MSLFEGPAHIELSQEPLAPGATTLRNFTVTEETEILSGFHDVVSGRFCQLGQTTDRLIS